MSIQKHALVSARQGHMIEVPGPAYVAGFAYDCGTPVVWIATTPGGPLSAKLFKVFDCASLVPDNAQGVHRGFTLHMGQGRFLYEMIGDNWQEPESALKVPAPEVLTIDAFGKVTLNGEVLEGAIYTSEWDGDAFKLTVTAHCSRDPRNPI